MNHSSIFLQEILFQGFCILCKGLDRCDAHLTRSMYRRGWALPVRTGKFECVSGDLPSKAFECLTMASCIASTLVSKHQAEHFFVSLSHLGKMNKRTTSQGRERSVNELSSGSNELFLWACRVSI